MLFLVRSIPCLHVSGMLCTVLNAIKLRVSDVTSRNQGTQFGTDCSYYGTITVIWAWVILVSLNERYLLWCLFANNSSQRVAQVGAATVQMCMAPATEDDAVLYRVP